MFFTSRARVRYADVMATLALVVALGGTAWAGSKVGGKDIADGTITSRDLAPSAVRATDLATGAVGSRQVADGAIKVIDLTGAPAVTVAPELPATPKLDSSPQQQPVVQSDLPLTRELFDNTNMHDPAVPHRITAKVAGLYQVTLNVLWEGNQAGNRGISIFRPAIFSPVAATQAPANAENWTFLKTTSTMPTQQSVSAIVNLKKGDQLDARGWQTSGQTLAIGANLLQEATTFSAVWLAPIQK